MLALLFSFLCHASAQIPPALQAPVSYNAHQWQLVWSDEFNGSGSPDPSKWLYETGDAGSANNEAQAYTDRIDNSYLENGSLVIEAKKEKFGDKLYTSARMNSRQSWLYGRFEFTAKLPVGRGTWPAIWFLPEKENYGTAYWPDNGEIDLLEAVGFEQNVNHFSVHTKDFNWMNNNQPTFWTLVPSGDSQLHKYTLDWYADHMDFWLDEVKYLTVAKTGDWRQWPFDQKFYIIMNLAVGGNWGGAQGIDDLIFPAKLTVGSVRVYKQIDRR